MRPLKNKPSLDDSPGFAYPSFAISIPLRVCLDFIRASPWHDGLLTDLPRRAAIRLIGKNETGMECIFLIHVFKSIHMANLFVCLANCGRDCVLVCIKCIQETYFPRSKAFNCLRN